MRVLVLTSGDPSHAHFLDRRIQVLSSLGVEVTTLVVPGGGKVGMKRSPVDYLRFVPEVLATSSTNGFDLVHANYGLTAPAALAQPKRPIVLSLWGTDLFGPFGWVSRTCAPRCDEVVVMSEEMAEALPCDASVIPHGIDLDAFAPESKAAARDRADWDADRYQVLFPYSPSREVKDFDRARRVVDAVDRRLDRPVELQVVHGEHYDNIPTYMNAADVLLLTSRSEGSPNTIKEAMACNLPVVSTDVGDVRDRLNGVEPSAVADTDIGLIEALTGILQRGEPSNGRQHVTDMAMERTGEQLLSVYERALAENGG